MKTHTHAARGRRSGWSLGRTLCIVVAGLALLGTSATAMADQNGKRDRGVRAVRTHAPHHDRGHHRERDIHRDHRDHRGHGNVHHNRGHRHHGRSHGHVEIHIGGSIGHGHSHYRPAPRPSYAQLEYQRGYADAQYAGFEAGKADALNWRPFYDSPNVCFDRVSSYYRSGYLAAYASAYREGYYAGESARQTVPLRYGNRSVRYGSSCRW